MRDAVLAVVFGIGGVGALVYMGDLPSAIVFALLTGLAAEALR